MRNNLLMKIGEVSEVFDGPHATPKKIDVGPYFLSISSLEKGQLDLSKSAHLSENQFIKWTKRVTPQEGDVLFSYETRLGEAALMPAKITACLGRRMGLLRPDRTKVLPEYLLYAYLSPAFQQEIKKRTIHGATVERIALRELPDFNIRVPTLEEQGKVVANLNAINGKITLNKQTNQTLEQMAQTLFKSWFVDFDPVFDNLLAKIDFDLSKLPTDFPEFLQKRATKRLHALNTTEAGRATLAKLQKSSVLANKTNANKDTSSTIDNNIHHHFPSEFEYNEQLGWIPRGWSVQEAQNIADIAIGKTPPRKQKKWFSNDSFNNCVWVSIKDMGGNKTFIGDSHEYLVPESISKFNVKVVPKDAVILSFKLTVGRVSIVKCDLTTNEAIAHFVDPKYSLSKEYVYLYLKCFEYNSLGSTSSIATAVNSKIIKAMPFLVPDENISSEFKKHVENIFSQIDTIGNETISLIKLRDTLLPKLISGELQIPDSFPRSAW